jgi:hypothetical protein
MAYLALFPTYPPDLGCPDIPIYPSVVIPVCLVMTVLGYLDLIGLHTEMGQTGEQ